MYKAKANYVPFLRPMMNGYIQVNIPQICRQREKAQGLEENLSELSGVILAVADPQTGKVQVRFNPAIINLTDVLSRLPGFEETLVESI